MATEEEAREAADGEEVQVEAADLGTAHLQMNLDSKLSSHGEIKDEAKFMDSAEGLLKVTEDQVSEKTPSAVEISPEDTPNGTTSFLNGHMKEEKISNEKPQENGQKDNEPVEASSDGVSTDQSNGSNGEEAVSSSGHVESTADDTSLLNHENEEPKEHYQNDAVGAAAEDKMVHEDTLQTDEPAVDAQQGQNLEPVEVTEDTKQHASTSSIRHDEVVAEAPAGVQTSLEPNVDDSDALPDATDGNAATEPVKVDKESCPEVEVVAEHQNEIVKLEDQPSEKTDDVDAEVVQEEVPKRKKTDVPEDMTTTEQANELTNGDQEELYQESPEDTSDPVHEKTEETHHESDVPASEETTPEHDATSREPALDVQEEQNQGLAEEIADAKEVDTEETAQQSGVAFEEATPEDNVATIEPSSDIQHVNNLESEETRGLEDAKAEETSNQSNVTIAEDAAQDKEATEDIQPVQGLEADEPKSTGTVDMDEASNQPHADVLDNLAEEDGVPAFQPQVELEVVKDTGVTETQEITQQNHAAASDEPVAEDNSMAVESGNDDIQKSLEPGPVEVEDREASETEEIFHERPISASEEDSAEDDVTAEGPTSDVQDGSVEEIRDSTADNTVEASNVATVEEADQENNVLTSEDVSEQKTREFEPEGIQNTEPVETEEASDQRDPAVLNDPAPEDIALSETLKSEPAAELVETEATKTEALPQESNVSTSEEPASEENMAAKSEITCDAQEINNLEPAEDVEGNKDTGTKEISDESTESKVASLAEMATEDDTAILTDASVRVHEQEPVEFRDTEVTEPQGISQSHIVNTSEESTPEDNVTAEPSPDSEAENLESARVTEETEEVKSTDGIAEETQEEHVQELEAPGHTPPVEEPELEETKSADNQMDVAALENPTHEDNPTANESLVMLSAEVSNSEATEGQVMPQSEVTQSEDNETEENTTASEPEPTEETRDSEATELRSISQQSIVSSSEESVPEEDVTAKEPASDIKEVQTEEPELVEEHNDVKAREISNQSSGTIVGETAQENLESATVTEETKDVESTDAIAEEETPEEHVRASAAPFDIPPVEEPELEETENTEPVEVHDNVTTNDQPAEEVKDTEATEIAEFHNESGNLTEDLKSSVALADEAAPDEDAKATEATADIAQAQEPELEEIKNSEPVAVENNILASDLPEEEIKDIEAMETKKIPDESTSANISELTNDVKSNVALADQSVPEEHVIAAGATTDIPRAQEPDLEEIKDTEPVEVEENISATDQSAEEIKATEAMETEAINERTDAKNSELTEDVNRNFVLEDEAAHEEHVIAAETTVQIPRAQEPELEEIKNTEPVEVKEGISASDLQAEEVKETEAKETEVISEGTDANISEPTEDAERNVVLADEAAPEEHVIATEATIDMPREQEPEIEEIKNAEHVEVEENISANDLPAEEVKDTETMETQESKENTDANVTELTEDVALADEAVANVHVDTQPAQEPAEVVKDNESTEIAEIHNDNGDLTEDVQSNAALEDGAAPEEDADATEATADTPQAQHPELEEIKNSEPVEVEDDIIASDLPEEEIKDTEAIETEVIPDESTSANISELTDELQSNLDLAEEAVPEEHVREIDATANIPRAQEPELEEIKNTEPVEVKEDISASDLPAEEVKETEVISESTDANISEPTEDAERNVAVAHEAAPEEHVTESEATTDIPREQEPELEEVKNTEPVEVEESISDPSAEEMKATEAMETEAINESIDAKNSELTADVSRNFALEDEAAHEEHVIAADTTVHIPRAQEPELEEIKNAEPDEVKEDISTSDLLEEEVKETEVIRESTDADISEPTEDAERNLADEAAPEEHVIATEATVEMTRAQEPELEGIENAEHVEVEENTSANDLQAEEVKETEATETEVISESTDADISEPTEDKKRNVALAKEAVPEDHVIATVATVDMPRAQEPELEEIENADHVEVDENISANDLPAEELKDTETVESEAINDRTDANITELTEDAALADKAVPDIHLDIQPAQEPAAEEINNTEPVEAEQSKQADDVPAEEINETEETPHESTDDSLTASAPLADIQQISEQEEVEDKKFTDTTEHQGEPQQSIVSTDAELTPTEENTTVTEPTRDTHVQNATTQEIEGSEHVKTREVSDHSIFCTAEVAAQESPLLGIEAVQNQDDQQHRVSNLEKPVSEHNVPESEAHVADQVQEEKSAEVEDTEAMGTEEISIQAPATENAAQESSEPGSDPDLLVQSEDSKDQLVKAEETGQINGASLEEPTAEDNAANETDPLADTKEERGLESVEGNKGIDATEGEEASYPSQDDGLEELVSESIVAKIEPISEIQQVNDLDEATEMTATEAIDGEETSCKKTEVATLEDPSPTDDGTPSNQKDESSDLDGKTAFTTQEGESPTEEDVVQISGEDTVGISNNIEKIEEQSKAVTEHDRIQSGDQTNDKDNEQLHNVELQMQVCERSLDVSAIEQPDEDVQKVNLDQQQNEDEAIEKQTEEMQRDEQKHDDSSTDLTTETLLEPQSSKIGTTNLHKDTDVSEAEQTETVATELLMNEQTPHILQGSIPSIVDVKVEDSTEIEEMPEQENAPNSTATLYTDGDAENYNEVVKDNTEIDPAVANLSTDEQDGPTDETINEEDGNGLASPVEKDLQKPSDPAPSNEENNPEMVLQNVEPRVYREEEECINKANDDMQAIQASEEEISDEVEEKQEMENEDTNVSNDQIQTKPVDEEASVLHSNDSRDTKVDDTMSPYAEMVQGRVDAQPAETEEVEENKGFSSISEYVTEKSKQNDVEQDLSIHPKVVDDTLATAKQNGAEVETNLNEEMATSYTAVTEEVKVDEAIDDKASGADGALSDENLETFENNRKNLEASSVLTATGESMNEDKEHHNLALPAHSAVDGNTTEQASGSEVTERGLLFPEKPLSTDSEEHEDSQTTKEQDETYEQETGDTEKEDEQSDLPVSNFLMNLIMGKQSTEPKGNSEAEKKQEETKKDDSCLITSQQEESLVPIPADLKVDNKPISEQGKHNLEGAGETNDFKLESEEEHSRNTRDLEAPVCQNNVQGEISSEMVPGGPGMMTEVETDVKLGEMATNSVCQEHMEAGKQIEEGSLKSNLDNSTNAKASQDYTLEEGRTELRHESLPEDRSSEAVAGKTLLSTEPDMGAEKKLPNNTDDLPSPLSTKEESTGSSIIEAESTIKEELENKVEKEEDKQHTTNTGGATEGQVEKSHDNSQKGIEAISDEQTDEITEPAMGTEINLVHDKDISAGSECQDEKQSYKSSNSELDNSEKALEIQSDGSSLHINQDKQDELAGEQIVMEDNNLLDKPGESVLQEEQETEIGQKSPKESDGGDQNCLAIREPVIKEENVNRTVESHVQTVNTESNKEQETLKSQVQEHDLDVVSAKEAPENEENVVEMAKPEFSTDEEQSPKKDISNMAGEKNYVEKAKDEEEAKSFTGEGTAKTEEQGAVPVQKVSPRDLNVVLPTEGPGSEESFVDVKRPEFSTDEEQSPKKDESNMAEEKSYDEKTNSDEEAKNFTDEAPTKTEEREAGQKASPKKHNILSGVGSKVKHQLAKVKKAIIGKPGHTKSELAKS